MTNMLRFLIFLFLGVCAYLTLNEKSNYSRYPISYSSADTDSVSKLHYSSSLSMSDRSAHT